MCNCTNKNSENDAVILETLVTECHNVLTFWEQVHGFLSLLTDKNHFLTPTDREDILGTLEIVFSEHGRKFAAFWDTVTGVESEIKSKLNVDTVKNTLNCAHNIYHEHKPHDKP